MASDKDLPQQVVTNVVLERRIKAWRGLSARQLDETEFVALALRDLRWGCTSSGRSESRKMLAAP